MKGEVGAWWYFLPAPRCRQLCLQTASLLQAACKPHIQEPCNIHASLTCHTSSVATGRAQAEGEDCCGSLQTSGPHPREGVPRASPQVRPPTAVHAVYLVSACTRMCTQTHTHTRHSTYTHMQLACKGTLLLPPNNAAFATNGKACAPFLLSVEDEELQICRSSRCMYAPFESWAGGILGSPVACAAMETEAHQSVNSRAHLPARHGAIGH
eukprot:389365-Pelagomonas_calceolata.AAC.3